MCVCVFFVFRFQQQAGGGKGSLSYKVAKTAKLTQTGTGAERDGGKGMGGKLRGQNQPHLFEADQPRGGEMLVVRPHRRLFRHEERARRVCARQGRPSGEMLVVRPHRRLFNSTAAGASAPGGRGEEGVQRRRVSTPHAGPQVRVSSRRTRQAQVNNGAKTAPHPLDKRRQARALLSSCLEVGEVHGAVGQILHRARMHRPQRGCRGGWRKYRDL